MGQIREVRKMKQIETQFLSPLFKGVGGSVVSRFPANLRLNLNACPGKLPIVLTKQTDL